MSDKRKNIPTAICVCLCILLSSCSQKQKSNNSQSIPESPQTNAQEITQSVDSPDYPQQLQKGTAEPADTEITLNGDSISINGNGASADGSILTISSGGSYILNGTLEDGQLIVDTNDEEDVEILLNGVKINCTFSSCINVVSAPKKVSIILCENSVNIFSDGSDYYSAENAQEDTVSAAIFSMEDLAVSAIGNGEIYVTSNCAKGIFSKDDLEISAVNLYVTSVDDGIRGKDSLNITNSYININSQADGIRTSNETDTDKGNMSIAQSQIDITSALDSIQSVGTLSIDNSTINSVSAQGYENAAAHNDEFMHGGFGGGFGGGGHRPDGFGNGDFNGEMPDDFSMPDGEMPTPPDMPDNFGGDMPMDMSPVAYQTQNEETDTTESTKGIKSTDAMTINGSTINVNSAGDAIHSNSDSTISDSNITIYAGDDALHADCSLTVNSGDIHIMSSYEGLEACDIIINGGNLVVNASDDGLNASDGSTEAGFGGFGGHGGGFAASDVSISVNDGYVIVNASGDGIDSNGTVGVSGGTLVVFGPTNGGNGALDYQQNFEVTGGSVFAIGSSQMAMSFSSSSYGILNQNTQINSGDIVQLADENGNEIFCFKADKNYQNLVFTSQQIKSGESYSINIGGSYSCEDINGILKGGEFTNPTSVENVTAK